jgi:hypothetical protein
MDLQNVDIGPESRHTRINRVENVFSGQSALIDPLRRILLVKPCDTPLLTTLINAKEALGHDDDAGAWNKIFPQGFSDDFFRKAIGIAIGMWGTIGIRRIHEFMSKRRSLLTVSQVLMPFLNAYSSKGRALSSFNTQSCHLSVPNDIVPKITLDILSPDFPRLFNGNRIHQYGEGSLMVIKYRT